MLPGELQIEETRTGSTATVAFYGELDLKTAPQAEAAIDRALDAARVVLDLRELSFVDSTGIQAVLRADLAVREAGNALIVIRGPRPVARLFALLELDDRLTVVDEAPDDAAEAA
jgi:anti-anti-sigma factor